MKELFLACYDRLGSLTPLKTDCGLLCGHACCLGSREDDSAGMYLYPGEEIFYSQPAEWFLLHSTDFVVEGRATPLLSCSAYCPREQRPLACRLFPLIPHIRKDGRYGVKMHPFAGGLCPLVERGGVQGLDPEFVRAARDVAAMLCENEKTRAFVLAQQRMLRDGLLL